MCLFERHQQVAVPRASIVLLQNGDLRARIGREPSSSVWRLRHTICLPTAVPERNPPLDWPQLRGCAQGQGRPLLPLVRQCIETVGDLEQSGCGVDHASGLSHSAVRGGLRSKLSGGSLGEVGPVFHDDHLFNEHSS